MKNNWIFTVTIAIFILILASLATAVYVSKNMAERQRQELTDDYMDDPEPDNIQFVTFPVIVEDKLYTESYGWYELDVYNPETGMEYYIYGVDPNEYSIGDTLTGFR